MKLDILTTYQFRNLKEIVFEAQHGINIIYGDNAQAVSYTHLTIA